MHVDNNTLMEMLGEIAPESVRPGDLTVSMVVEVYNASRKAEPRRILIAAMVLLGFSSALAATLTWHRAMHPLAARFQPAGWTISFEPPRGWAPGSLVPSGPVTAMLFHGSTHVGKRANLAVWQLDGSDDYDLQTVCTLVLAQHRTPLLPQLRTSAQTGSAPKLGRFDADERGGKGHPAVVRAARASIGTIYAVSLSVENALIDEQTYRLFDLTCRSIRDETQ